MARERNFGSGTKFWVRSKILGQWQNFGSGAKFWVRSEILSEQNFGLGANYRGEINFESTKRNKVQLGVK